MNSLEEVYKQIDAEAEEAALVYPCSAGDDEPRPRPEVNGVRKSFYIKGATPYAEKWQEEKELRERYEKALNTILSRPTPLCHKTHIAWVNKAKQICNEALAPKTSTDE